MHRYGKAADKTLSAASHISPTTALRKKGAARVSSEKTGTQTRHTPPHIPGHTVCILLHLFRFFR
ncbi:hypothetical protein HMPREF1548_06854 [Clostridium sp. KLE 1755]|nr:hypothetical protein HMPREF1548_06854 [Clostridium sp. KLE 1755]